MDFSAAYRNTSLLMEGALGERLKREYHLSFDDHVAMASLVYNSEGQEALTHIWQEYLSIASKYNMPFMATTPTRRANKERVAASQYNEQIIGDNVSLLKQIKETATSPMFVGGLMGCKGDAYRATEVLSVNDADKFHSWQSNLFKENNVDFLFAGIMPALSEAVGMAKAMDHTGLPYIVSFMIQDNGRLIDGTTIHDAIWAIDNVTRQHPLCYMANCVHPCRVADALSKSYNKTPLVKARFCGIQANTSPLTPEELDNSADLKCSDATNLADEMFKLSQQINLKIVGGCCGTDNSHIEEIAKRASKL